jgi:hypothetical protein
MVGYRHFSETMARRRQFASAGPPFSICLYRRRIRLGTFIDGIGVNA